MENNDSTMEKLWSEVLASNDEQAMIAWACSFLNKLAMAFPFPSDDDLVQLTLKQLSLLRQALEANDIERVKKVMGDFEEFFGVERSRGHINMENDTAIKTFNRDDRRKLKAIGRSWQTSLARMMNDAEFTSEQREKLTDFYIRLSSCVNTSDFAGIDKITDELDEYCESLD